MQLHSDKQGDADKQTYFWYSYSTLSFGECGQNHLWAETKLF